MLRTPSSDSFELITVPSSFPTTAASSQRNSLVHRQDDDIPEVQTITASAQTHLLEQHAPQTPRSHMLPSLDQHSLHPKQSVDPQIQPRYFADRIGSIDIFILGGGTAVLLMSVGFLIFLWAEAQSATRGDATTPFWNTIAHADQITQSVTITAAVMRTVMAAQLALATAMIAALYLEVFGTRLQHVPVLSMMRTISVSPLNLMTKGRIVLTFSSGFPVLGLVVAMSLVALVSHFISTVLVSDLLTTSIPSPLRTEEVIAPEPYYYSVNNNKQRIYLTGIPGPFYRFAEYQESLPAQRVIGNTSFLDTGLTFRASLPWTGLKERLDLRWFSGSTIVWDAGVTCFTPNLSKVQMGERYDRDSHRMVRSLVAEFNIVDKHPNYGWFGSLLSDPSNPRAKTFRANCDVGSVSEPTFQPFFCSVVLAEAPMWLNHEATTLIGVLKDSKAKSHDVPRSWYSFVRQVAGPYYDLNNTEWNTQQEGPWASISSTTGQDQLYLTICAFNNSGQAVQNVEMFGAPASSEPGFSDSKLAERAEDGMGDMTSEIRRQLGILPDGKIESLDERGVLSLKAPSFKSPIFTTIQGPMKVLATTQADLHWKHKALLREVFITTGNPALTVQAFSTVVFQAQIMDLGLGYSGSYENISFIGSQDARIPTRHRGLIAVGALAFAHTVVVYLVVFVFFARTKTTRLGQAWQSIAQVVSDQTRDVLERADGQTDEEVKKLLGMEDAQQMGVVRRRPNGRNEFGPRSRASSLGGESG